MGRDCNIFHFILRGIFVFLWLITITGFHHLYNWPIELSLVVFLLVPFVGWRFRKEKIAALVVVLGFLGMIAVLGSTKPSNDRNWAVEFSILPRIHIADQLVTIEGFRNFEWKNQKEFDPIWEKRLFDLEKLQSLDLVVEPFKDSDYMAHTMLRFGFADQGQLIVSVEARREKHEGYNLIKGAFRQFELIYLFGAQEDLLTLRAVHRGTRLYVYPIKAERQFMVDLFKELAKAANALHAEPKFYRSIRDNCTTTLVKHFNRHHNEPIGLRRETLFPALTGKLLYQMGYMDTDLSYEKAQEHFRFDEVWREFYEKNKKIK